MSAYNQVPRLSTGPSKMAAGRLISAAVGQQRKWRVLVSIGLLLPALAAIIGIVAWTISIEVANSDQQSPVSMAQRRTERAQQQQLRRDEALALAAAMVAARRSSRPNSISQQQQQQQQQSPASNRSHKQHEHNHEHHHEHNHEHQRQHQQQLQQLQKQQQQQQQQQQMFKNDPVESSLVVLKNLGQVEALNEFAQTQAAVQGNRDQRPAPSSGQADKVGAERRRSSPSNENTGEQSDGNRQRDNDSQQKRAATSGGAGGLDQEAGDEAPTPNADNSRNGSPADAIEERVAPNSSPKSSSSYLSAPARRSSRRDSLILSDENGQRAPDNLQDQDTKPALKSNNNNNNSDNDNKEDNDGDGDDDEGNNNNNDKDSDEFREKSAAGSSSASDVRDATKPKRMQHRVMSRQETKQEQGEGELQEKAEQASSSPESGPQSASSQRSKPNQPEQEQQDSSHRGHKSRWLNADAEHQKRQASRRPVFSSESSEVTRKLTTGAKLARNSQTGGSAKKQQQLEARKSKYTLIDSSDDQSQSQSGSDELEAPKASTTTTSTSTTTTTSEPPAMDASVDEQSAAASADCPDRAGQVLRSSSVSISAEPKGRDETDEDISFEAIASAISKSLSSESAGAAETPAQGASSDWTQAGQSSMLNGDSAPTSDLVNDNSESSERSEETGASVDTPHGSEAAAGGKRRRTTGEHLAEVIDHLVEKRSQHRRHRDQVYDSHDGVRFGDRSSSSNSDNQDEFQHQHHQGPQIVVVAPVGASGALLKARSLTRESDSSQGDKDQKMNQKAVAAADSGKAGLAKSAPKKPVEPAKKVQEAAAVQQSGATTSSKKSGPVKTRPTTTTRAMVGARLLGTGTGSSSSNGDQKGSAGEPESASGIKYSERVEVIHDDDSSALLMNSMTAAAAAANSSGASGSGDAFADSDQVSSIHVSSHSGEPRLRSPRHEMSSMSQILERYAPVAVAPAPAPAPVSPAVAVASAPARRAFVIEPPSSSQAKLYSAEQLIREHIKKSKTRSSEHQAAALASGKPAMISSSQNQQSAPALGSGLGSTSTTTTTTTTSTTTPASVQSVSTSTTASSSTSTTTTSRPPAASETAGRLINGQRQETAQANNRQQQAHPAGEPQLLGASFDGSARPKQVQQRLGSSSQFAPSVQSVQVPAFFMQQQQQPSQLDSTAQVFNGPSVQADQQYQGQPVFQPANQIDAYQVMESQQQQVRMEAPPQQQTDTSASGQQEQLQQKQQQQQLNSDQQQQQLQQQQREQVSGLPTFADQEFQVPAHMAESVIRDLQQSPSSVTGMLNGQPTVFQAVPPNQQQQHQQMGQVPHYYQNNNYHRFMGPMGPQQQQHQQQNPMMGVSESQPRPHFMAVDNSQQQQPQQQQGGFYSFSPMNFMSRLAAMRRQQEHNQHQQHQQQQQLLQQSRQVLANREGATKDEQVSSAGAAFSSQAAPPSLRQSVKALGASPTRALVQPVAQMALKHLFSSLGQQAAAQQAQADAEAAAAAQHSQRHRQRQQRSSSSLPSMPSMSPPAAPATVSARQEPIEGSPGLAPVGAAGLPPMQQQQQQQPQQLSHAPPNMDQLAGAAADTSARSMRSLPIGGQAPESLQQVQAINDQEVSESYGQMPTYHMADHQPHYGGGGGGSGHYESPDKKSKGITFHFGGGPIGGGTQLITSPMGIFRHLMIPLMPSPRVNLNGKIVFGVVLEKTTAFGPPPKKKYKFWGK